MHSHNAPENVILKPLSYVCRVEALVTDHLYTADQEKTTNERVCSQNKTNRIHEIRHAAVGMRR